MKTDIQMYDELCSVWNEDCPDEVPLEKIYDLYEEYMPQIYHLMNKDFFSPTDLDLMLLLFRSISSNCVGPLRSKARDIFIHKNARRRGTWKDVGAVGALIEIHAKLSRLSNEEEGFDEDSMVDLFNYAVIASLCVSLVRIKPGNVRKRAIVTGTHAGGLGNTIRDLMMINGIDVWSINDDDLKSPDTVKWWFKENSKDFYPVDYVVNNFGKNHLNWIGDLQEEDFALFDHNLKIPLAVLNEISQLNPCKIVNVASQTYRVAQRCTSAYCASKAGLVHMTRVAARELASRGFVINAIAPGKIEDTNMSELTDEQVRTLRGWNYTMSESYAKSLVPAGRYTRREEVALAILKILELPNYINGTVIDMTGGQ